MPARRLRTLHLFCCLCAVAASLSAQVPVENLKGRDILPLEDGFNAHPEQLRLLLLLSPGCARCLDTSAKVEELLRTIDDPRVQVLVVWEPLLPTDDYAAAQKTAASIPDRRAVHYWEPQHVLGLEYGRQLALPGGLNYAVDMVLLFDPGARWSDKSVPAPAAWFHNLGDDDRKFSPGKLYEEIDKRLGAAGDNRAARARSGGPKGDGPTGEKP